MAESIKRGRRHRKTGKTDRPPDRSAGQSFARRCHSDDGRPLAHHLLPLSSSPYHARETASVTKTPQRRPTSQRPRSVAVSRVNRCKPRPAYHSTPRLPPSRRLR
uniref:Uncharacterized protein n=1 Tax=Plectus sambesii TaxID=2011161 RepID=A0A914UL25_9BILA